MPPDRSSAPSKARGRTRASTSFGALDRLTALAESEAGAWAARARSTTTAGQERAILRLFGVHGLDRSGRPLASAVVDRWQAADPHNRTGGVTLPFAMALLEYDLVPQQLALDVAAGTVDLAMEAELLREPDRRAVAEVEANRLADAAIERIDANRVVRREILSLLGEPVQPWIGMTLEEPDMEGALDEMGRLVAGGVDLVRVEIPVGRELADRLSAAGLEVPAWKPRPRVGRAEGTGDDPAPTGSQRALAEIRVALDEAAAERRAYARLATASPALGAPEGAVVAAFERIDLTEANPMVEIIADGVDPDRALSDHAFAHRLHRRAGTLVSISAGSPRGRTGPRERHPVGRPDAGGTCACAAGPRGSLRAPQRPDAGRDRARSAAGVDLRGLPARRRGAWPKSRSGGPSSASTRWSSRSRSCGRIGRRSG